jgi:hypothetical protein
LVICEIHKTTERWEDHIDVIGEDKWSNVAYNYQSTHQKEKEQQTSGKKIIRLEQGSVTNNTTQNFKLQKLEAGIYKNSPQLRLKREK